MTEVNGGDAAATGFAALIDAIRDTGDLVRDPLRGVADAAGRAHGYAYASELVRAALDLYADADGLAPRFVPFSTPTPYHAGDLAIQRVLGGANPDGLYDFAMLRSDCGYLVRGRRGNDCYLSLSISGGRDGEWPDRTAATMNDRQMTLDTDGAFEVAITPEPRPDGFDNWVRMEDDMCALIVRQYFDMKPAARRPASLSIQRLTDAPRIVLDPAEVVKRRLLAAAAFIRSTNAHLPSPRVQPSNAFGEPIGYGGESGALGTTDNTYCTGRWNLAPEERLIIETTPPACAYWSVQLWNRWGQSVTQTVDEADYGHQIVNNANATLEPDGSVRVVVAHEDPGEPNWLDTFGWPEGTLIFRFLYPEGRPEAPRVTSLTP